jgi:hypothetical protein
MTTSQYSSDVLFGYHRGEAGEPPSISGHVSRATGVDQPKALLAPPPAKSKTRARVSKGLSTGVSTKRIKPVPRHSLKRGVSKIPPISPRWNTHTSPWRTTCTTEGRPWPVAPLEHKIAIVPPILVLAMSKGTSSKLTTPKPNTPTTFSMWRLTSRHKLTPLPRVNGTHHTLTSHHQPRLRHTTRRVVPVLVGQLSGQPLPTLPLEAELSKVPIPPITLTMEGFRFWFWFWVLFRLWFLLTWFLLTQFLSTLPKELIPQVTLELDGFLEVVGLWGTHGWSWGCV